MKSTYCKTLECEWSKWEVLNNGLIQLTVPEGNAPNMEGAIRIANILYRDCTVILVVEGDERQVVYVWREYGDDEKWEVFSPQPQAREPARAHLGE